MLMRSPVPADVYLCVEPVDFRKGMIGLATLVESEFDLNPFSGQLFVFCNRRRNQIKILYWDRNGFCLWQKRLEQDRFPWFKPGGNDLESLSMRQLEWLLEGLDPHSVEGLQERKYSSVC